MTFQSFKNRSRQNWGSERTELSNDEIKLGAILRIADAAEAMATNHNQLIDRNKFLEDRVLRLIADNEKMARSNRALRGHMKRMTAKATHAGIA